MAPQHTFDLMMQEWIGTGPTADRYAEDVVIETPFAPPGHPTRIEGRDAFLAVARAGRAALPVHFDHAETTAVHETADPEVIVVEYELGGTVIATGRRGTRPFIGVLRVRDGLVMHWREYQDTTGIARMVGGM